MISNKNEVNKTEDINKDLTLNSSDEKKTINEIPNAERVENVPDTSKSNIDKTKTEKSTTVSTTNKVSFSNPIDGIESRSYTYPAPVKMEEGIFRTIRGINLEAKIGTEVKAPAEGVVELVENSGVEEGVVVEIKHANGLKTRYGNLDANVLVKKGDKIKANQVIAKVGDTAKVFSKEVFGEFLNLQVIDAKGEQVNPEKYFTLKSK
jgi:murein DD-endopeptidase MepM/ murein hydrolase activator NlpD